MYISRSISISYIVTTQKNDENQAELKQTSEMNAVHINCYTNINKISDQYMTEQYMTEQYIVEQDTTVYGSSEDNRGDRRRYHITY